jgi:hypothetical protein
MKNRATEFPVPEKGASLTPEDFSSVLSHVPEECVLIGGQAVAWWARRYGAKSQVTSRDIDFWGTREDLMALAANLHSRAAIPNRYERTLLLGAIGVEAAGKKTAIEFLHSVPGLDHANPEIVAVPQVLGESKRTLLVMSPVSLVLIKLHALRHFSQEDRQDELHLRVSIEVSRPFIVEILAENPRLALWNCRRLIDSHLMKVHQKLEGRYGFSILEAIPVVQIRAAAETVRSAETRKRLTNFLENHWPRVAGTGDSKTGAVL